MAVASPSPVKILSDLGYEIWEIENDADLRSALIEAINTLSMGNPSDQRIPILQEAVKNIKRSKFKERIVNVGKLMNRKASSAQQISPQKLLPAASESGEGNQTLLTENLAKRLNNIAENLNALSRVLKQQFNLDKQSAQQSKIDKDEEAKKAREGELEGGKGKGILRKTFNTLTKPFGNFFDAITRWLNNVLLGAGVLALLKWLQDPENRARIQAFWDFLTDTLPKIITQFFDALQSNWLARILFPGLATATMSGLSSGKTPPKPPKKPPKPPKKPPKPPTKNDWKPSWLTKKNILDASKWFVGRGIPWSLIFSLSGSSRQQAGGDEAEQWLYRFLPNHMRGPDGAWANFISLKMQPHYESGELAANPNDPMAAERRKAELFAKYRREFILLHSELQKRPGVEQFLNSPFLPESSSPSPAEISPDKNLNGGNLGTPISSNGTQILDLRETASAAVGGSSGSGSASSSPSHIKGANSLFAASILSIGNA